MKIWRFQAWVYNLPELLPLDNNSHKCSLMHRVLCCARVYMQFYGFIREQENMFARSHSKHARRKSCELLKSVLSAPAAAAVSNGIDKRDALERFVWKGGWGWEWGGEHGFQFQI